MNHWQETRRTLSVWALVRLLILTAALAPSIWASDAGNSFKTDMLVSTEWLADHLRDSNLIVLCIVDDERFYLAGHIPGARMIRLAQIVTTREAIPNELPSPSNLQHVFEAAGLSNNSHIILYGERSGILAARAYFTLDYLGLADRAALLDGGVEKWRAERREDSTAVPAVRVTKLGIRPRPEILVSLAQMTEYSRSAKGDAVLMDARPPSEYAGEKLSEDVSKAGHIPNAVGLYWRNFLRDDSSTELKPANELEALFHASGVTAGKEVVSYCRTGMQSSFSYFVAKYLGYRTRMYDGSFYEWSRSSPPVQH
ncbi:MAG: hypothetical protein DMG61_22870 [Acidobacteria bacterium]|nr:MAG: hypothetical protein DMG61_22870 [Acidobacteriota bacterium]PYY20394.1 MAG: hypothetical protein DMG60_00390 [Acidobacteriota bacterium]